MTYQPPPSDWATRGGKEELIDESKEDSTDFFYQKWYVEFIVPNLKLTAVITARYDPEFARFEDPPLEYTSQNSNVDYCPSCLRLLDRVQVKFSLDLHVGCRLLCLVLQKRSPVVGEMLSSSDGKITYK